MFDRCSNLEKVIMPKGKNFKYKDCSGMFAGSGIQTFIQHILPVNKICDFNYMFSNCKNLEKVKIPRIDKGNRNVNVVFNGCDKIRELDLTDYSRDCNNELDSFVSDSNIVYIIWSLIRVNRRNGLIIRIKDGLEISKITQGFDVVYAKGEKETEALRKRMVLSGLAGSRIIISVV